MTVAPVICIPHGGGPLGLLGDPSHKDVLHSLGTTARRLLKLGTPDKPRAIIIITAHWSERCPTISSAQNPPLYYDYRGFPDEAYKLKYDAPGSPEVAREIFDVMKGVGLSPAFNNTRGWDHGTFIPLIVMNPEAEVPIVQLSVLESEDPHQHFLMGQALSKLRSTNVAILGSGFASLHNIRLMLNGSVRGTGFKSRHGAWTERLTESVSIKDPEKRQEALKRWRDLPYAYEMHPPNAAEHFMPLLVCAGAAGNDKCLSYKDDFMGFDAWTYYWMGASE